MTFLLFRFLNWLRRLREDRRKQGVSLLEQLRDVWAVKIDSVKR